MKRWDPYWKLFYIQIIILEELDESQYIQFRKLQDFNVVTKNQCLAV